MHAGGKPRRSWGKYLAQEGLLPDLAVVSPATRTRETFTLAMEAFEAVTGEVPQMLIEPRIYESQPEQLLKVVRETQDGVRTLMMVGHNPGTHELARRLTGFGDRYAFFSADAEIPDSGYHRARFRCGELARGG